MKSVLDVARYILEKNNEPMSVWKLHKLCFYCQAYSYFKNNIPLFNEDFEAWSNGPISSDLFKSHNGINKNQFYIKANTFYFGDSSNFSESEKSVMDTIFKMYGSMETYDLMSKVQSEEPWIKTRSNVPNYETNIHPVIDKNLIKDFYTKYFKDNNNE